MEQIELRSECAATLCRSFDEWIAEAGPGDSMIFFNIGLFATIGEDGLSTLSHKPQAYVYVLLDENSFVNFGIAYDSKIELEQTKNTVIGENNIVFPSIDYSDYSERFIPYFALDPRDVTSDTFKVILEFAFELSLEPKIHFEEGIEVKV